MALTLPGPLVGAGWLAEHHDDPELRVVDLRWYLDGRSGRAAYEAGHVPGAVFVDLEGEVTGRALNAGRHPLPAPDAFQRAMRAAGVSRSSTVVVYDDSGGGTAARLWWLLRHFGHGSVAVLDGGLAAWAGALAAGPGDPVPAGDFVAGPPRREQVVDYEDVRRLPEGSVLLDARAPERYRGEVEPVDPRAGHIPGARSAFFRGNLDDQGRFLAPDALRRRYEALGAAGGSRVVVYCGSGVNACHDLLALELAGIEGARLYAGSWSDWSNRPEAPAATGPE